MSHFLFLPLLSSVAFAATAPAAATLSDDPAAMGDSLRSVVELHEVDVVASFKDSGPMRQQPASVTLIGSGQMSDHHIVSLKGASAFVPNVFMPDYGSRLTSAIYIRGIGSRLNTPAVGLYVDNIPYVDKSAFDFNFYDIERVDVLRGPQGTLYGRNAMGGLMRVYTRNPFEHQGTDLRLGYATGDSHRNLSLSHSHRLGQHAAFTAGGYYEGGDGFFVNDQTGQRADAMQAGGGRFRLLFDDKRHWLIDFSASYDYTDEGAYPYFYVGSLTNGTEPYPELVGHISNNRESSYRRSLLNTGLNVQFVADTWRMNAVTGYQFLCDRMFMDQDFLAPDIYTLEQKQRIGTFSQEVTFKNTTDSRWHWLSGINFMYQTLHTEGPVTFYNDGLRWLEQNINRYMPDVAQIPSLSRMGFSSMEVNFRDDALLMGGIFETPALNAALFHQSTFHLTPSLSFTLGVRLDYERLRMDYQAASLVSYGFKLANPRTSMMQVDLQDLAASLLYDGMIGRDYLKVLPKATLNYDFGTVGNLYLSVAKGQRSGGYNVQMFSDLLQGKMQNAMMLGIQEGVAAYLEKFTAMGMPPSVIGSIMQTMADNMPVGEDPTVEQVFYRPEYSWNYEVGTHLNLADYRLLLDAAVFLIETRDQQIARFAPSGFGRMMVNAGSSRSYGAELSARFRPDNHWTFVGNYGFTHATFTDYDMGGNQDYTGNYVPFVPGHTFNLDVSYSHHFDGTIVHSLTVGSNLNGTGRLYWTESNSVSQPFYATLGARIALDTDNITCTLWGKNLTDRHYQSFYFESASRGFEQYGKPLQVGVDLTVRF